MKTLPSLTVSASAARALKSLVTGHAFSWSAQSQLRGLSKALITAVLAVTMFGTVAGNIAPASAAGTSTIKSDGARRDCPDGSYILTFQSDANDTVNNLSSTFDANLAYKLCSAAPVAGASITFKIISGPNTGTTASGVTDANGDATFNYTSVTCGLDTIQASYSSFSATVQDDWIGCDNYHYNLWITNWGYVTGIGGLGVTPDIWVPAQGNNCSDTSINNPVVNSSQNTLCVRLHNDGSPIGYGQATLTVGFRPCCITGTDQTLEPMDNSLYVPVPVPAMASGTTTVIAIPWTLSSGDDFGGSWGGYSVGHFSHFCVQAIINFAGNQATPSLNTETTSLTGPGGGEIGPDLSNGIWGYPFPTGNPSWWTTKSSWAQENFELVYNRIGPGPGINTENLKDQFLLTNPYRSLATAKFEYKTVPGVTLQVFNSGKAVNALSMKKNFAKSLLVKITVKKAYWSYEKKARLKGPIYAEISTLIKGHQAGGITYELAPMLGSTSGGKGGK